MTTTFTRIRFWADFAAVEYRDRIWVSMRDAEPTFSVPAVGELVDLYDFEGNRCIATVVELDETGAVCQIVLDSWVYQPPTDLR